MNKLLFLGTGNAEGIPVAFCDCATCLVSSGYDERLRSSVYLDIQGTKILIDAGPDLRLQLLKHKIDKIDALLLTHLHYDHIGGLDELRAYNFIKKQDIPLFLSQNNYSHFKEIKPYLFVKRELKSSLKTSFNFCPFNENSGEFFINGVKVRYVTYEQGVTEVNGFLFGKLAYFTDIKTFSDTVKKELYDLDYLIISVSHEELDRYSMHLSISEIIDLVKEVKPKKTLISHIGHFLDVVNIRKELPKNVEFAFDGLEINF